ncbi:MAG: endonuclease/exonuclease/phosphatase family protein [Planctomycetota bacterium]|nr:endonuclease/exonuclease/phosphatase family protein [Planctomycetota bacterium]
MKLKSCCIVAIGFALLLLAPIASAQELVPAKQDGSLRIATYNVSLNRSVQGKLREDLEAGNEQVEAAAAVIRAVQPDILLLNEVDYVAGNSNAEYFANQYISAIKKDALGGGAFRLPYVYDAPVNTGVPSGMDLNQNEKNTDPEDAWGYGRFPGQYGMAVLSRFELDKTRVRTLQKFLWSDLPGALRPQADGQPSYYDDTTWKKLRLSSKSFWDVPIKTPLGVIHVLASHPTPPAFDGPEDRNGCRNHDEILLIQKYIEGAEFLRGDNAEQAGLREDDSFVVMGDLNSDPADGGSRSKAIQDLLKHSRVAQAEAPQSRGAVRAAKEQGRANLEQSGDPSRDTGDFNDRSVGNLRIDYVLPSSNFKVVSSGVFWPDLEDVPKAYREAVKECMRASDHHLVWVDVVLP